MQAPHDMWNESTVTPLPSRAGRVATQIAKLFCPFPWISVRVVALASAIAMLLGLCSQLLWS